MTDDVGSGTEQAADSGPAPQAEPVGRGGAGHLLVEVAQTVIVALVLFVGIQAFLVQPFKVEQVSMQHTFESGDYVLVDKLTPRWDGYDRGDVVVFASPGDSIGSGVPFIKRVIGLPGDTVAIPGDGRVLVNGVALDEPYLFRGADGAAEPTIARGRTEWSIPDGQLFVMGDHRQESIDSRSFGPIEIGSVIGRGVLRYWPLDSLGMVATPGYPGVPGAGKVP